MSPRGGGEADFFAGQLFPHSHRAHRCYAADWVQVHLPLCKEINAEERRGKEPEGSETGNCAQGRQSSSTYNCGTAPGTGNSTLKAQGSRDAIDPAGWLGTARSPATALPPRRGQDHGASNGSSSVRETRPQERKGHDKANSVQIDYGTRGRIGLRQASMSRRGLP